jgi:hypothetical protein
MTGSSVEGLKQYQIEVLHRTDILHYRVAGIIKTEYEFFQYIRDVNVIIKHSDNKKVLADCKNLEGFRPGVVGAIRVVDEAFSPVMRCKKIAVIEREENHDNLKHREIVAYNRGYTLEYFTDHQSAEAWLEESVV